MEESKKPDLPEFPEFDLHLEYLIQQDHPRIMNLEKPIPAEYPWELLLSKHFANPPFDLDKKDYEVVIEVGKKVFRIQETRKPTTFYSLLRFLEFFRANMHTLHTNLTRIEEKYDQVHKTKHESTGIRGLLRRQWTSEEIDRKHEIIAQAMKRDTNVDSVLSKLETILAENLPVTSRWQYLLEPFVREVIQYINNSMREGPFNLRMYYPVRSMEEKLRPHYSNAMRYAVELIDAVQITTTFLKHI
ncbi:MAG: hypothetical protein K8S54_16455 [Spirochaetia bacterium]|nr:hypothetical protein [Spirochaetia bacterium]